MIGDKGGLQSLNDFDFPFVAGIKEVEISERIPFNCFKTEKQPEKKWVHFFIDDYQFERVYNFPNRYISLLQKFRGVMAPDFSLYTDMPMALQIYSVYKNRYLSNLWQKNGITVIPTVSWSTPDSYSFCFEGIEEKSVVAVSTNGCLSSAVADYYFRKGYREMLNRLNPAKVIIYGRQPKNFYPDNAVFIESYSQMLKKRLK